MGAGISIYRKIGNFIKQKWGMHMKNIIIVLSMIFLSIALLIVGFLVPKTTIKTSVKTEKLEAVTVEPTQTPNKTQIKGATQSALNTATPTPKSNEEVQAYLYISAGNTVYDPIPLTKELTFVVNQNEETLQNVIRVTPTSVVMHSANCDNQNCIHQGEITLENMKTRIFGNSIYCLPNQVVLTLYTAEEVEQAMENKIE